MLIKEYINEHSFIRDISAYITKKIKAHKGVFHLALSGGKTPIPIYKTLSGEDIFTNTILWQVDERYIPDTELSSNTRMIRETINNIFNTTFICFDTSLPIHESLEKYKNELRKHGIKWFDMVILGVGIDGHIASLFPGTFGLSDDLVINTKTERFEIKERLTINYPMIINSKELIVILKGKKAIMKKLEEETDADIFPASILKKHKRVTIFSV